MCGQLDSTFNCLEQFNYKFTRQEQVNWWQVELGLYERLEGIGGIVEYRQHSSLQMQLLNWPFHNDKYRNSFYNE